MNRMNSEGRKPARKRRQEERQKARTRDSIQTGPRTEAKARSPEGWKRTYCSANSEKRGKEQNNERCR